MTDFRTLASVRHGWISALSILVAIALISAGCGSTPADSSTTPADSSTTPADSSTTSEVALPIPEVTEITLASASIAATDLGRQVADALDLWGKYGLNVDSIVIDGGDQTAQALQSGQAQVASMSGGPVVASLRTSSPLLTVAIARASLNDRLYAMPEVADAEALRGQGVAISGVGGASHGAVLVSLDVLGLTPEDVVITAIGGAPERLAALSAGSIAAATLAPSEAGDLEQRGYNVLVDLAEMPDLGFQDSGLVVSREFADQNPNTVLALVAAYLEGLAVVFSELDDPDSISAVYAQNAGIDEEEATALLLLEATGWSPLDGVPQLQWYEAHKSLLVEVEPEFEAVDPSDAFTTSFTDELRNLGLYEQIGLSSD